MLEFGGDPSFDGDDAPDARVDDDGMRGDGGSGCSHATAPESRALRAVPECGEAGRPDHTGTGVAVDASSFGFERVGCELLRRPKRPRDGG